MKECIYLCNIGRPEKHAIGCKLLHTHKLLIVTKIQSAKQNFDTNITEFISQVEPINVMAALK